MKQLMKIYEELYMENDKVSISTDKLITTLLNKITKRYLDDNNMSPRDINSGVCMDVTEEVTTVLEKQYNIRDVEYLSDDFFYDMDMESDIFFKPEDYGSTPKWDYLKFGLPGHYWIYYNGKHYDVEKPEGVKNFFDLPTFDEYYTDCVLSQVGASKK